MIDLHVHTNYSDGSTSPADLVSLACAAELEAVAITDHDTLAGYDQARFEDPRHTLELICGVELSTRPEPESIAGRRQRSIHLLGYFLLCPPAPEFRIWLQHQQAARRQRNVDLVANLQRLGLQLTLSDAEVYGRNQVGRPHFAKVLCDKGYVVTMQQAFDLYLADDAKAAVARDEPSLEEGIRRIRNAGGLTSLAHPVRLPQQNIELECLVAHLADMGLQGIEVYHSEHDAAQRATYQDLARRFDLIPTGGSDFHGQNKPSVQLGTGLDSNVCLHYSFLEQIREMFYARACTR